MEISDLIKLVDVSISHFTSKVSGIIDEIVVSNEEAPSINLELLTKEFVDQLYKHAFTNYTNQQLIIHTSEINFGFDFLKPFLNALGVKTSNLQFIIPNYAKRIVSIYLNQHPRINLFSLTKDIPDLPEYLNLQEELVSNYREGLDTSYEIVIDPKDRAKQFLNNLIYANLMNHHRGILSNSLNNDMRMCL